MGNSSSQNQNIDGPPIKSRNFTNKQQEEQANEYPTKPIKPEDLKFFADGDIDEVKRLLREGYDPSSHNNQPLSFALRHEQKQIIRLLLQEDKVKEKLSDSDKEKLKSLNIEYGFRSKKKSARKTKKSARKTKKSVRKSPKKCDRKNRK